MALTPATLREELRQFLAGGAYMELWRAVMDATAVRDSAPQWTDDDRAWYDALYELVYMGAEDSVSGAEHSDGIMGAAELRQRIRAAGLDRATNVPL